MSSVMVCHDGIEVVLENEDGLWVVLREVDGNDLGRFKVDPSELRATIQGDFSYQATDGLGNSVSIEGDRGNLKVRLDGKGFPTKLCRLEALTVENAVKTLKLGV